MKSDDPEKSTTSSAAEIIELNVGGCVYATSRTTLMSCPESMLSRMISGQIPNATDSSKRLFIDRDGTLFRYILNYMRDKRLHLPENFSEHAQLRQEADFYRIEPIIVQLDAQFGRSSLKNSLSLTSLATTLTLDDTNANPLAIKGIYFTIISKLYQGTLISLIGCIRILGIFATLDANSRRFMSFLLNPTETSSSATSNNSITLPNRLAIEGFVCECKFMHEEKLICCKPCGLNGPTDAKLVNLSQSIVKLAKRCGLSTSYWEDMFYLSIEASCPNREYLSAILNDKHAAKLITSSVCDHRSSYDENTNSTLIERWSLPDINSLRASIIR